MSWCLWQAFFAQTLQLSLPSEQLCADRPRKPLTVLNSSLPSQPVWPCMPGGVNWCSPNTNKTCSEHSTGQSCATGAGSKGLEAFDGEEMMNVGAAATLCYKANRNKLLTVQSQMCTGHQLSVHKSCHSNQFMLKLPYTSRAVAKTNQGQENFRIKATHNNPQRFASVLQLINLTLHILKRNSVFEHYTWEKPLNNCKTTQYGLKF